MKTTIVISAAILAAGAFAGTASAQSDRTLGINCTVAGHSHCGENGPVFGSSYGWRHRQWRDGYGAYAYTGDCHVIRKRIETPSGRIIFKTQRVCD